MEKWNILPGICTKKLVDLKKKKKIKYAKV